MFPGTPIKQRGPCCPSFSDHQTWPPETYCAKQSSLGWRFCFSVQIMNPTHPQINNYLHQLSTNFTYHFMVVILRLQSRSAPQVLEELWLQGPKRWHGSKMFFFVHRIIISGIFAQCGLTCFFSGVRSFRCMNCIMSVVLNGKYCHKTIHTCLLFRIHTVSYGETKMKTWRNDGFSFCSKRLPVQHLPHLLSADPQGTWCDEQTFLVVHLGRKEAALQSEGEGITSQSNEYDWIKDVWKDTSLAVIDNTI